MQATAEVSIEDQIRAGTFRGIASNLHESVYHAAKVYLSSSNLTLFEENAAIFKALGSQEIEETDAMRLGTLLHMRLLEPERFDRETALIEGHGGRTEVKEAIAKAEAAGKTIFRKQDERDQIESMARNVLDHSWASRLILNGEREKSYFADHPEHGFPMKVRTDAVHEDLRVIADLKTISPREGVTLPMRLLESTVKKRAYDLRALHYLQTVSTATGKTFDKFALVWVSSKAPYPVRVTAIGPATMDRAAERLAAIYERYAACWVTDSWPGYPDDIEDLELFFL